MFRQYYLGQESGILVKFLHLLVELHKQTIILYNIIQNFGLLKF
jgi:hypothetical protein